MPSLLPSDDTVSLFGLAIAVESYSTENPQPPAHSGPREVGLVRLMGRRLSRRGFRTRTDRIDVMQSMLASLWMSFGQRDKQDDVRVPTMAAWRRLRFAGIDRIRRDKKHRRCCPLDLPLVNKCDPRDERDAVRRELAELRETVMRTLDPCEFALFAAHELDGVKLPDCAERFGISRSTTIRRLNAIKGRLRANREIQAYSRIIN